MCSRPSRSAQQLAPCANLRAVGELEGAAARAGVAPSDPGPRPRPGSPSAVARDAFTWPGLCAPSAGRRGRTWCGEGRWELSGSDMSSNLRFTEGGVEGIRPALGVRDRGGTAVQERQRRPRAAGAAGRCWARPGGRGRRGGGRGLAEGLWRLGHGESLRASSRYGIRVSQRAHGSPGAGAFLGAAEGRGGVGLREGSGGVGRALSGVSR